MDSLSKQMTQNVGCLVDISDSNPTNNDESADSLIHSPESGCGFIFFTKLAHLSPSRA